MGITYREDERIFALETPRTSYLIGVVDEEGFLGHIYYGKRLNDYHVGYLLRTEEPPYVPSKSKRDRRVFLDTFPTEYPTFGVGDYRESALTVRDENGCLGSALQYRSHTIAPGKPGLPGLPATFADENECATLEIRCEDPVLGLWVTLSYSVFEDLDVITRSVRVENAGKGKVFLERVLSASLDMDDESFEMITLHGAWARERHIQRRELMYGLQSVGSTRGKSSHQDHPFMALVTPGTTQEAGDVYAMHFVYSGNFLAVAEKSQYAQVRMALGIHPQGFCWRLLPGETFQAPEAVLTYSDAGLGAMTRTLHDLYRRHLIRSPYLHRPRPILLNNWEATYFDFDTEKLLEIAREAAKDGIEMLVMDDGWFGRRNDDNSSLGDWTVNEEKLPGGLQRLVEGVRAAGLRFGIWFEPEMISPDSDLYRAHPDWAIQIPGREPAQNRAQYVLDLSRPEVIDYVYESVAKILRSAEISYVKWDMNRELCDIGGAALEPERQGELLHRYTLGVYALQERLVTEFPDLLLENCSGGGARFDPGMLYYSPQIWCSDDTDAIERLAIQEGTALIYPLSAMGAHVSVCPNHALGRVTPFETRGHVALAGTFGYELDITKLPPEERAQIPGQVELYHRYHELIREGDYYRLASWGENGEYDCWLVAAKDASQALVTYVQVLAQVSAKSRRVRLRGLDPQARYRLEGTEQVFTGEVLMNAGVLIGGLHGDFRSKLLHFVRR